MNKTLLSISTSFIFVLMTMVCSCQNISTTKPVATTTSSPSSLPIKDQLLLTNIRVAMSKVNSVNIDSDLFNAYTTQRKSEMVRSATRWNSEESIDVSNSKMHLSQISNEGDANGNLTIYTTSMYYDNENSYQQVYLSLNGSLMDSSGNGTWSKFKIPEGTVSSENQLSYFLKLLKNVNEVILPSNEKVNAEDCRVISIIPSAEAVADWLISQTSAPGPGLSDSTWSSLVGENTLTKTFQGGIFQLWVDGATNLVVKAELSPHFAAILDNLPQESDFAGQLNYSNYNQAVSITIPQEVLNAK